ncbi:MAG: hypothetical protein ABRQ25_14665 [Clostridiaceae bacterium]
MIKDSITVTTEGSQSFDKLQLALAISNSTYEDELSCSLLENNVIQDCGVCNLKDICSGIDQVAKNYYDSTTGIVNTFNF